MADISPFNLQRDQLYKQVAEQLQHIIVEEMQPGDRLPSERELALRLGISRTVVREAIRALAVRGLVKIKPGCGTFVRALTPRDAAAPIELFLKLQQTPDSFRDLYEARCMIETEGVTLAAKRATEQDVVLLEATLTAMAASQDSPERYTGQDLAFHLALAAATHNQIFPLLLGPITNLLSEAMLLSCHAAGAAEAGVRYHRAILDALRAGDAEQARLAMQEHIHVAQEMVGAVRQELDSSLDAHCEGEP